MSDTAPSRGATALSASPDHDVQQRNGFTAPPSGTEAQFDMSQPNGNRAKSFHGTADLEGSAMWSDLQRQDPGEAEDSGGAAVNPWAPSGSGSGPAHGAQSSSWGAGVTNTDAQAAQPSRPSLDGGLGGEGRRANGRRAVSYFIPASQKGKGKGKERAHDRQPLFPMPRRAGSTLTVGSGLEGHASARGGSVLNSANGAGGWDALESGERWNARTLRSGETPLDRTIDHIGMGRYQKTLLVLSGLGYLADNMWLQGVAIVLPRVQDEWEVSDRWIGLVSSSTFAGMMVGAIAWGSYSDSYGRKNAFNGTLFVTAVFGCASSFATSFPMLCVLLFLLGTGVGGSMPTDGTLFLENLPKSKQYLLTALSTFFALGSVITSLLGLAIIPANSCPDGSVARGTCDKEAQNQGWRWLLNGLGLVTVCFVAARLIFFKLFESPKFLVASGRPQEARVILQRIAAFNGRPLPVSLRDVEDEQRRASLHHQRTHAESNKRGLSSLFRSKGSDANGVSYAALPTDDEQERGHAMSETNGAASAGDQRSGAKSLPSDTSHSPPPEANLPELLQTLLPTSWHSGAAEFSSRFTKLFEPRWRRTTLLIWAIWTLVSLAFTIFNVFLPKFLEARLGSSAPGAGEGSDPADGGLQARKDVMQDFLLYAFASVPGSLVGAWMIETRLGRIGSMALSTICTALSILAFTWVSSRTGIVVSSMLISISATTVFAAVYGYTPEVFTTDVRGTACGSASALSRLAGIVAPLTAGLLIAININLPLFLSIVLFAVCAGCMLALPYETRRSPEEQAIDAEESEPHH